MPPVARSPRIPRFDKQIAVYEQELAKLEAGRLHERSTFQSLRRDALKASIARLKLADNPPQ